MQFSKLKLIFAYYTSCITSELLYDLPRWLRDYGQQVGIFCCGIFILLAFLMHSRTL